MIDNQLFALFTDTSRLLAASIFEKPEQSTYDKILTEYMADSSLSYLGIILILLGLCLGLTAAALILDKKDKKAYSKYIENSQKLELLKQVATVSN